MPQDITVVIPCRVPLRADPTLDSLLAQTCQDFQIVIIPDKDSRGAPWARNQGFKAAQSEFVLFSDDDISWEPDALENLLEALRAHPEASYSYGAYLMDNRIQCNFEFDADLLLRRNFVSTMSLVRSAEFPGFDEKLRRLQDWDLWLTMLQQGKTGVYCGKTIFSTVVRNGITYGSELTYPQAVMIVKKKHRLA